jgi:HD-GYP domain-containing protein (c-di-GMP phosphodiesterase class II)
MQRHPSMGVRSLLKDHTPSDLLLHAILVAFEHHQRLDMSGYPKVTDEFDQNLLSRIVAIADCYDALTTPRVYKQMAMKPPQALSVMMSESGTTFDPDLLNLFIRSVGFYPLGSLVKLDTGEIGVVYSVNPQPQYIDRPSVKIIHDPSGNLTMTVADLAETEAASGTFKHSIADCLAPSEHFKHLKDFLDVL